MNLSFDEETGIATIYFLDDKIEDSDIKQNIVIDYNKKGQIVALEIFPYNVEDMATGKQTPKEVSESPETV